MPSYVRSRAWRRFPRGGTALRALALCAGLLAATAVHGRAEDVLVPVTISAPAVRAVQYVTGRVAAVSCADPARGQRSEMTIRDENGRADTVLVKATTTIYDGLGAALTLESLRIDQKVKVKYITSTEGVREALSIMVVP